MERNSADMPAELSYRMLHQDDMGQMHRTFLEAFSEYSVNMNMSREAFERRMLEKLHIDFSISPGVYSGDKLIGFIFHAKNQYEGKLTAYNGGTGVIPGFTGQGIPKKMHEFVLPELQHQGIAACVLEVITSNKRAIRAYEGIGFEKTKTLKCFKRTKSFVAQNDIADLKIERVPKIDFGLLAQLAPMVCGLGDQLTHIKYNLKNEHVVIASIGEHLAGYIIYQYRTGRISQMAIKGQYRNQEIGSALLNHATDHSDQKALTLNNVLAENEIAIQLLTQCGFENQLDQYEMQLSLD